MDSRTFPMAFIVSLFSGGRDVWSIRPLLVVCRRHPSFISFYFFFISSLSRLAERRDDSDVEGQHFVDAPVPG